MILWHLAVGDTQITHYYFVNFPGHPVPGLTTLTGINSFPVCPLKTRLLSTLLLEKILTFPSIPAFPVNYKCIYMNYSYTESSIITFLSPTELFKRHHCRTKPNWANVNNSRLLPPVKTPFFIKCSIIFSPSIHFEMSNEVKHIQMQIFSKLALICLIS